MMEPAHSRDSCSEHAGGHFCHLSDMLANPSEPGFLTILNSASHNPLQLWTRREQGGQVKRVVDNSTQTLALQIIGSKINKTFISCPCLPRRKLGIKFPILVLIVKNLKKYFGIEIEILDSKGIKRHFHSINHQTVARVSPSCCSMPMRLDDGWNQVQINLMDITKRAYGTNYVETLRLKIHANCRIQRVYFSDRVYAKHELPEQFMLARPVKTPKVKQAATCV